MKRRVFGLALAIAGFGLLAVLGGSTAAAQEPTATVDFVDGVYFTPTQLTVSAVNSDGTLGEEIDPSNYDVELSEIGRNPVRLTIEAGCYRISLTGFVGFKSPLAGRWAACLEAGERRTYFPGVQDRVTAGRGTQGGSVITPDGSPVGGVGVELHYVKDRNSLGQAYYFLDSDQAAAARNLDIERDPGASLRTGQSGSFFTLLDIGIPGCGVATFIAPPGYTFPTGREYHRPLCSDRFATIITRIGEPDPGRGYLDLPTPAEGVLLHRMDVTSVATGQSHGWQRNLSAEFGGFVERLPVVPGCYDLAFSLETRENRVWAESTQVAGVERRICVDADEFKQVDVPPTRELSWDAGQPVLPGQVVTQAGDGVSGVQVDLFWPAAGVSDEELRDADHGSQDYRGDYYATVFTDADGNYREAVFGTCFVITFVAPDGYGFENGSRYLNQTRCQGDGNPATIIVGDGEEPPPPPPPPPSDRIGGAVIDEFGAPVAGVSVDYFSPGDGVTEDQVRNGDHVANDYRGSWLSVEVTGPDGRFSQEGEGCVVLTYIAPDGFQFTTGKYLRQGACGDQQAADVVIFGERPETGAITGTVTDGAGPASGVVADLFLATADGSRGDFLGDVSVDDAGVYQFGELEPRCYVIVLIAPAEFVFVETGNQYVQSGRCVGAGEVVDGPGGSVIPLEMAPPQP